VKQADPVQEGMIAKAGVTSEETSFSEAIISMLEKTGKSEGRTRRPVDRKKVPGPRKKKGELRLRREKIFRKKK